MRALIWLGAVLLLLGMLVWFVFKVMLWLAVVFLVAGLLLVGWGAVKVRGALGTHDRV